MLLIIMLLIGGLEFPWIAENIYAAASDKM